MSPARTRRTSSASLDSTLSILMRCPDTSQIVVESPASNHRRRIDGVERARQKTVIRCDAYREHTGIQCDNAVGCNSPEEDFDDVTTVARLACRRQHFRSLL